MSVLITSRCLVAFLLVPLISVQSFAKGGGAFGRSADRYNPDHIKSLPPEIREAVINKCGTARALHPFASYTDNLQKIVLHFEHFSCNTGASFCGPSGCLHQVYASSHGHFRLIRSYYAPAGD